MFGLFKKRATFPSAEELSKLSESARADVKEKWIFYDSSVHLNPEISLGQKIESFAQPLTEFFRSKYPQLLMGGSEIFWLTTFTAILESGTHPKEAVNAAVAELQTKYGGKG